MNRPYIIVNVAASADGKIDSAARRGAGISSPEDKRRVDELRASVDAVLVGGRTLLDEDPKLTVKSSELRRERVRKGLPENPAKVGMASVANVRPAGNFMTAGPARRIICTTKRTPPAMIRLLENLGAKIFLLGEQRVDLPSALESLFDLGIRRLLVEGGGTTIAEFFRLDMVDELSMYLAPRIFGGATAPTGVDGPGFLPEQALDLKLVSVTQSDDQGGVLIHYLVPHEQTKE